MQMRATCCLWLVPLRPLMYEQHLLIAMFEHEMAPVARYCPLAGWPALARHQKYVSKVFGLIYEQRLGGGAQAACSSCCLEATLVALTGATNALQLAR